MFKKFHVKTPLFYFLVFWYFYIMQYLNTLLFGNYNLKGDFYFATLRLRFWWSRHIFEAEVFAKSLYCFTHRKVFRIFEKFFKTTCEGINFFREVVDFRPTACNSSQVFPGSMRNLYRIIPGALKMTSRVTFFWCIAMESTQFITCSLWSCKRLNHFL